VIKKLPKCLHTCLHCKHAVISEEYSWCSQKLVYDGCWKHDDITLPVNRETCEKFEESIERVQRKFWKKWNWKVHINGDLVTLEQGSQEISEPSQGQSCTAPQGSNKSCDLLKQANEPYGQAVIQHPGTKRSTEHKDITDVAADTTTNTKTREKKNTTRTLIQQALANRISRLKDIAHFAGVDPSTAHYHLRTLIEEEKVTAVSRGRYTLSGSHFFEDDTHLLEEGSHFFDSSIEEGSHFFEGILENLSQYTGYNESESHPIESKILLQILSTENKYIKYSERDLAKKCKISRNTVKKYTRRLEEKGIIEIRKEHNQYIYIPTDVILHRVAEAPSLETGAERNLRVGRDNGV
jgi:DNA-binding MarR family transcriptional regulator